MLHQFLTTHRQLLIDRCQQNAQARQVSPVTDVDFHFGIPLFLDQLIWTLQTEESPARQGKTFIRQSASRHGRELLAHGYTVEQVVHDYGDLCQCITGLAIETSEPVSTEDFKILNRCLDDGIADAVMAFAHGREAAIEDRGAQALNERIGMLAHELRNHLNTATMAVSAIKMGTVGMAGATAGVLDRSLLALRNLIDLSLADVRVEAGMPGRQVAVSVPDLMAELRVTSSLGAAARGCKFSVIQGDAGISVHADRDMLLSAVSNLLQNAFKFTQPGSEVVLRAHARGERVLIDVQDHCGGLKSGDAEVMFMPFKQVGADRTGMGLGLSICRRSVEANGGTLSVRNEPGSGCVFTIDLPRL